MTRFLVRAAIYCRISRDSEHQGLGVARQRSECESLARKLGLRIEDTFVDNDISAYSGRRRPEYERLMTELDHGRFGALLCWHPDRLNRSPRELEQLIDLLDRTRVTVHTVTAGFIDFTTPSGRAVARTLGAWARYESEHKSERIRAKTMELALDGRPIVRGTRPFGFTADGRHIVESEAVLLREMMGRLLVDG